MGSLLGGPTLQVGIVQRSAWMEGNEQNMTSTLSERQSEQSQLHSGEAGGQRNSYRIRPCLVKARFESGANRRAVCQFDSKKWCAERDPVAGSYQEVRSRHGSSEGSDI